MALTLWLSTASAQWSVGHHCEVQWKGSWYKADIIEHKHHQFKIHYHGYNDSWDEWVGYARMRPVGGWHKHASVEVEWKSSWYAAKIIHVDGDRFKVHYDGYADSWDEWVSYGRMRHK